MTRRLWSASEVKDGLRVALTVANLYHVLPVVQAIVLRASVLGEFLFRLGLLLFVTGTV